MATYRPGIDQSQRAKSVSHIIIICYFICTCSYMYMSHFFLFQIHYYYYNIINIIVEMKVNSCLLGLSVYEDLCHIQAINST